MKKITIIGAGIGGLTTAIALKQKGFEVEIFENTPAFSKAGSGINLAINAMQVFKRLNIYDDIFQNGNYINTMNVRTKKLGFMARANLKKFENKYQVKQVAMHRATLHDILLKHLGPTEIYLNKKLKSLDQTDGKINLAFEDGTNYTAEIVIGADGINSAVRQSVFDNTELRDAGQVCWRGISMAKIDDKHRKELNEIWGKGNRFGFVPITKDEVYWFALIDKKAFKSRDINLLDLFSGYHQTVSDIIMGTPKENILCNEIWDLKPIESWYKGNVCLLGDAGHATTPNMGQGAVQAVESALALSICLKEESSVELAFSRFQALRKKKANHVTNTSWKIGKLAQTSNPVVVMLRDLAIKMTPSSVMDRQNKNVFELNY